MTANQTQLPDNPDAEDLQAGVLRGSLSLRQRRDYGDPRIDPWPESFSCLSGPSRGLSGVDGRVPR